MSRLSRRSIGAVAIAAAFAQALAIAPLQAQGKTTITFAGVTFSEAGRGDKLRAWVEKFNKSQDKIEVQPIGLPFATFANTMFTQMGGGGGPDLVRFDHDRFLRRRAREARAAVRRPRQGQRLPVHARRTTT